MISIVGTSEVPVSGFEWWGPDGARYATLVAKASFDLAAPQSKLSSKQQPLIGFNGADDNVLTDRVPFKARAEVVVEGVAYAPGRDGARSFNIRIAVDEIDKSLGVIGDRTLLHDGTIREGAPIRRLKLGWDKASRGPNGKNPMGRSVAPVHSGSQTPLPNLVPDLRYIQENIDATPPVGLGPIPAHWAPRRSRGTGAGLVKRGHQLILPAEVEPLFFQTSPDDQQQAFCFGADPRLILENLHPTQPRLVTNLEPLYVAARIRTSARDERRPLHPDTIYVDTENGVCLVTYRAVIRLSEHDAVAVEVATGADRGLLGLSPHAVSPPPAMPNLNAGTDGAPPAPPPSPRPSPAEFQAGADSRGSAVPQYLEGEREVTSTSLRLPNLSSVLPFQPDESGVELLHPDDVFDVESTSTDPDALIDEPGSAQGPPSSPSQPAVLRHRTQMLAATPEPAVPWTSAAPIGHPVEKPAPLPPPSSMVFSAGRAPESALEASNDARPADRPASEGRPGVRRSEVAPRLNIAHIEFLWLDPGVGAQVSFTQAFKKLLRTRHKREVLADRPHQVDDAARELRDVLTVLSQADPTSPSHFPEVRKRSFEHDKGGLPPLIVIEGELVAMFDAKEVLEATIGMASPFLAKDRALKEAIDVGEAMAKSEWTLPSTAELATRRIREALARTARDYTVEVQATSIDRTLLERRRFRSVTALGEERLRMGFSNGGSAAPIPFLLPKDLRNQLPLYERLPIRALVELRARQDEQEPSAHALVLRALARRL